MRRGIDLACAWGGVMFAALFAVGYVGIARFMPPLDPDKSAAEIAAVFQQDTNAIRTGLLLCFAGCICYLAFGAAIIAQTRRIPGAPAALSQLQIAAFSSSVLLILFPIIIWFTAAYRPDERSIEMTQTLNDLGWIAFLMGYVPFVTWYIATGVAILCDNGAEPIFPRWAGYVAVLTGTGQTSATFLIYFKTGPFAWDGLFSWWLPAAEFFTFFAVMTLMTTRAINNQYRRPDTLSADGLDRRGVLAVQGVQHRA